MISPPKSTRPVTLLVAVAVAVSSAVAAAFVEAAVTTDAVRPGRRTPPVASGVAAGGAATSTRARARSRPGTSDADRDGARGRRDLAGGSAADRGEAGTHTERRDGDQTEREDDPGGQPGQYAAGREDGLRWRARVGSVDALHSSPRTRARAAIFLDVDGTLAPIVDDPADSARPRLDARASSSASPRATRSSRA